MFSYVETNILPLMIAGAFFAIGITFFVPNMIGLMSERYPKAGSLGIVLLIRFVKGYLLILLLLLPAFVWAQNGIKQKKSNAYRLPPDATISFDGKIDEKFWKKIEPATGFTQQVPREGAEATERTEVRIAFDDKHLYMGVILYDSNPSGIKAYLKRRDVKLYSDDRFHWIFDTYNDQRNAYWMEVNPNGLRTDALLSVGQGSSINFNWDGIWDARTKIGDFGWSIEIKIPFSTFNFDPESSRWGVNFLRKIQRKNETVLWTGYRRSQGISRPQDAGVLTGLSGISQGVGLEVVPFGIVEGREEPISATDEGNTGTNLDGGFDVNYSITPSLKASFTYNTDFAEAEVDQRYLIFNLCRVMYLSLTWPVILNDCRNHSIYEEMAQ